MSYGVVLVFDGAEDSQYWDVNERLGVNADGTGDWPEGLERHVATRTGNGLVVTEVWDSKDAQERFMADRLGAALACAAVPPPAQVLDGELLNTFGRT
jgi:hypothetical protein